MNKQELIKEIAVKTKLTQKQSSDALNSIVEIISGSLKSGEKVILQGFGSFDVKERAQRMGRNPRTGKEIKIPATKVAKFNPSAALKTLVAGKAEAKKTTKTTKKKK